MGEEFKSLVAMAFNEGADARLAGKPRSANPYEGWGLEWSYWLKGWEDVERNYAAGAGGWDVRPLPPVREENTPHRTGASGWGDGA